MTKEQNKLIGRLLTRGGGEDEPIDIDVYLNTGGLITISLTEETWVEISPLIAKQLLDRLREALIVATEELVKED